MDGHLVTVEVGVECGTYQRMQLDGLALDQDRLESLNAQTVQRGSAVQKYRMFGDDLFENVPNITCTTVDCTLGCLDVCAVLELDKALHDEGLEQLESHVVRQAALMHLQLWADNDDRTA